ncbi:MAG: hypothetical protein HDP28_01275 [Clostridia bacterium]|nr:hypothetical protein [Clostridia bacterium]
MENESKENLNATDTDSEAEIDEETIEKVTEETPPKDNGESAQAKPLTKKQLFLQLVIFTLCMASAGVIQFVVTGLLSTWTGLMSEDSGYYWIAYLVGLVLSVIWSFTFNRKFTFKAASNLPLAMVLVALYYCAFAPLSTFGANAIVKAWKTAAGDGWDKNYEMVITVAMMLINFVTEFLWEKFVVFNDRVMEKLERKLHIKHKEKPTEQTEAPTETVTEESAETTAHEEAEIPTEQTTEEAPAPEEQAAPPTEEQNHE